MKCEYCGAELAPGAETCPACGAKCAPGQTEAHVPAKAAGNAALPGEPAENPPEKKKKNRAALIVAAVVILAALLAVILPKLKKDAPGLRGAETADGQTTKAADETGGEETASQPTRGDGTARSAEGNSETAAGQTDAEPTTGEAVPPKEAAADWAERLSYLPGTYLSLDHGSAAVYDAPGGEEEDVYYVELPDATVKVTEVRALAEGTDPADKWWGKTKAGGRKGWVRLSDFVPERFTDKAVTATEADGIREILRGVWVESESGEFILFGDEGEGGGRITVGLPNAEADFLGDAVPEIRGDPAGLVAIRAMSPGSGGADDGMQRADMDVVFYLDLSQTQGETPRIAWSTDREYWTVSFYMAEDLDALFSGE